MDTKPSIDLRISIGVEPISEGYLYESYHSQHIESVFVSQWSHYWSYFNFAGFSFLRMSDFCSLVKETRLTPFIFPELIDFKDLHELVFHNLALMTSFLNVVQEVEHVIEMLLLNVGNIFLIVV